jgi:hypothetical protein
MIQDRHLQDPEEILRAIQGAWSYFTFENFPKSFQVVDGATNLGDDKQWEVLP